MCPSKFLMPSTFNGGCLHESTCQNQQTCQTMHRTALAFHKLGASVMLDRDTGFEVSFWSCQDSDSEWFPHGTEVVMELWSTETAAFKRNNCNSHSNSLPKSRLDGLYSMSGFRAMHSSVKKSRFLCAWGSQAIISHLREVSIHKMATLATHTHIYIYTHTHY